MGQIHKILGKGVTSDFTLDRVGKQLFKNQWLGVFLSSVKPIEFLKNVKKDGEYYGILNTAKSKKSAGVHWLGVVLHIKEGNHKYYVWDSFGRPTQKLVPQFIRTIGYRFVNINTNGSNQTTKQDDCGARTIAWLLFVKKNGLNPSMLI